MERVRKFTTDSDAGPFELVRYSCDEDQYGRKLRVIKRDGRSISDTLVAEGLARRFPA